MLKIQTMVIQVPRFQNLTPFGSDILKIELRDYRRPTLKFSHILVFPSIFYKEHTSHPTSIFFPVPKPSCIIGIKFTGRLFCEYSNYPCFLSKKVKKLKHPIWNFHNLRHRYASKLSQEGRPLFEIMSLLGHYNLTTTQGYLQSLGENRK